MSKNQQPRPEEVFLWQEWYRNSTAPQWKCRCCRERYDVSTSFWTVKKSFRTWYISVGCGNFFDCRKCGIEGLGGACRGFLRLEVPIRKPQQVPGTDYSTYNVTLLEQPSDEWRARAGVLPRTDGIYQSKSQPDATNPGFSSAMFVRFNQAGQVFQSYSSDDFRRVAQWIGQPGLDYEATANNYSSGLYSVEARKITFGFPPRNSTEITSVSKGTINRAGTTLDVETWATRTAKRPMKYTYKFRAVPGMS